MNRGARNSVAAQDWALKRKQQMERAARIKAERATAAPSQLEEGEGSGGGGGSSSASAPGASPPEDGGHMLRSCSQPTSDMPMARLPARATTSDRPEWARDLAQQNRQTHAGGDSPQYGNSPPDTAFPAAPTGSGAARSRRARSRTAATQVRPRTASSAVRCTHLARKSRLRAEAGTSSPDTRR